MSAIVGSYGTRSWRRHDAAVLPSIIRGCPLPRTSCTFLLAHCAGVDFLLEPEVSHFGRLMHVCLGNVLRLMKKAGGVDHMLFCHQVLWLVQVFLLAWAVSRSMTEA